MLALGLSIASISLRFNASTTQQFAMKVFVDERYGSDFINAYNIDSSKSDTLFQSTKPRKYGRGGGIFARLRILFVTVFLPQGYPDSVSEDYLEYQIWDTAQAFCSSITGSLATRAVLKGYGVGDETATATAATITWMLKDGTGMLGRILFAWSKGTQLDCDAKRWRLFADILNDVSILLDLLSPLFKGYFTLVSCISGVAKSVVGVAGGATRAALTQHQARRDNMADVSAKDGSQETLVNLLALITGLVITPMVASSTILVWMLFLTFTILHLYSNYKAVSAVVMETVNLPRYHILVEKYINSLFVLTPKEVSRVDPVIRAPGYRLGMNIGCKLSDVIHTPNELRSAFTNLHNVKYIMRLDLKKKNSPAKLNVALHRDVTHLDLLTCCFTAVLLDNLTQGKLKTFGDKRLAQTLYPINSKWETGNDADPMFTWGVVSLAHDVTAKLFPSFYEAMKETGWNVDTTQFGTDEWRLEWQNDTSNMKML